MRSVSGVVAALIILLMFTSIVLMLYAWMRAQEEATRAQIEAVATAGKLAQLAQAIVPNVTWNRYQNLTVITVYNGAGQPIVVKYIVLLVQYQYDGAIVENFTVLGEPEDPDTPTLDEFLEWYSSATGQTIQPPSITAYLVSPSGAITLLGTFKLPITVQPGYHLVIELHGWPDTIAPVTAKVVVTTVPARGALLAVVATAKVATMGGARGAGYGFLPAYAIPINITCIVERQNWPTAVYIDLYKLFARYGLSVPPVLRIDLYNNSTNATGWVPVNYTVIDNTKVIVVFPLTCNANQTVQLTLYINYLYGASGKYDVGVARQGSLVQWLNETTYLNSTVDNKWYYIVLETRPWSQFASLLLSAANATPLTPLDNGAAIYLPGSIPYANGSSSRLYVYAYGVVTNVTVASPTPDYTTLKEAYGAAPALYPGFLRAASVVYSNALPYNLSKPLLNTTFSLLESKAPNIIAAAYQGFMLALDNVSYSVTPYHIIQWFDPTRNATTRNATILFKPLFVPANSSIALTLYAENNYGYWIGYTPLGYNSLVKLLASGIQPPNITAYRYVYFNETVPSEWSLVAATTVKTYTVTPFNISWVNVTLPFQFPMYGRLYNIVRVDALAAIYNLTAQPNGYWNISLQVYNNTFATLSTDTSTVFAGMWGNWNITATGGDIGENITIYIGSGSDELGEWQAIRVNVPCYLNLTINYYYDVYGRLIGTEWFASCIKGPINYSLVLYKHGVIRYTWSPTTNTNTWSIYKYNVYRCIITSILSYCWLESSGTIPADIVVIGVDGYTIVERGNTTHYYVDLAMGDDYPGLATAISYDVILLPVFVLDAVLYSEGYAVLMGAASLTVNASAGGFVEVIRWYANQSIPNPLYCVNETCLDVYLFVAGDGSFIFYPRIFLNNTPGSGLYTVVGLWLLREGSLVEASSINDWLFRSDTVLINLRVDGAYSWSVGAPRELS